MTNYILIVKVCIQSNITSEVCIYYFEVHMVSDYLDIPTYNVIFVHFCAAAVVIQVFFMELSRNGLSTHHDLCTIQQLCSRVFIITVEARTEYYHIHSNKCPGGLTKSLRVTAYLFQYFLQGSIKKIP